MSTSSQDEAGKAVDNHAMQVSTPFGTAQAKFLKTKDVTLVVVQSDAKLEVLGDVVIAAVTRIIREVLAPLCPRETKVRFIERRRDESGETRWKTVVPVVADGDVVDCTWHDMNTDDDESLVRSILAIELGRGATENMRRVMGPLVAGALGGAGLSGEPWDV